MKPNDWQDTVEMAASAIEDLLGTADEHAGCWADVPARLRALTSPPAPAPAHAQPVAWEMRYWNSGYNMWHDWERITAEQHAEMSVEHATSNDYEFRVLYDAPPAPAANTVPDFEAWFNSPEAGLRVVNFHIQHELQLKAWNACVAAMLAQPVSGGYKLPDSVLVLLNHIEDVIDDENWNRISVKKWNVVTMLAAAPEGGE